MNNLKSFLAGNAIKVENIKYVASKRFVDKEGNPIPWEIKAISNIEDEEIRNSCTKKVQVPGKTGTYIPEIDFNNYAGKLAAACTLYPDLLNAELQDSYHVTKDDDLLKAMLTPGEYIQYITKVQEINGFGSNINDLVEEAKN